MAKFIDIGYSDKSTECAMSKKVTVVIVHGVAHPFVYLQMLVVVYIANLL